MDTALDTALALHPYSGRLAAQAPRHGSVAKPSKLQHHVTFSADRFHLIGGNLIFPSVAFSRVA